MERSQHDVKDLAIRTRLPRFVKKPEPVDQSEDHELNLEAKSSTGSTPRKPASRRNSSHESIDESLEDDFSPGSRHRGHDYRHVQARENGRMQLGDNTYIMTQNVYHNLEHPDRAGQGGKQIDLLEALAFDHMDTRLAGISVARGETCRWLFDTVQHIEWQACSRSSHHGFLWIKGKPGAGTSTMMKCALEEARNHPDACIVASFFFNARGHGTATTTEGMYRALLFQILTQLARRPTCVPEKVAAIWKEEGWPIPMLQDILRDTIYQVGKDYRIVFYIDALDECAEDDVREALQHLEELRDQAVHRGLRFHACFASRHFPNITMRFCQEFDLDKQEKHFQDITDYVDSVLRAPPSAHAELAKEIVARCAGIFLWAVLTVRILNKMHDHGTTHSQLRARMRKIPAGIEDLFWDILERKDIYLVPTLLWILFAKRALRLDELYFAIRASPNQLATGIWNPAEIDMEGMRSFVLKCSRGLVDTSGGVTQLLHESLREYLLNKGLAELDPELKSDLELTCHTRLAEWCLSYLTPDTERYLGPHFGSTETTTRTDPSTGSTPLGERRMYHFQPTERLPFLGYVLLRTMYHMGAGPMQSKPPAAILGRYADLWLTLRLDRSCTFATEHCAALLCFSLARSYQNSTLNSATRWLTSSTSMSFSDTDYLPAESDSFNYLNKNLPPALENLASRRRSQQRR